MTSNLIDARFAPAFTAFRGNVAGILVILVSFFGISSVARAADYSVPVNSERDWELLTYSSLPANEVSFSDDGVAVVVRKSASPLIHPLPNPLTVKRISIAANIIGDVTLGEERQGESDSDDFVFRLGLVHEGTQTLNFLQRSIAADWIKKLYNLAPDDTGIDKIRFYNVYSDDRLADGKREHPLTELMTEHFIAARPADGKLELSFTPEPASPVLALWISIDGDNTQSSYEVQIREITLHTD